MRPLLVIGISGATWSVIRPMLAEGALPNIAGLVREGAWGVLESVKTTRDKHYRPQTAWPSLLSGKLPERHGITEYFHTFRDLTAACVWDHFNAMGLSAGLYATPMLWPPPRINGFVVPPLYARDGRAWPPELSFVADYYRRQQDAKLGKRLLPTLLRSARFVPLLLGPGQDWRSAYRLLRATVGLALARNAEYRALILRQAKLEFSTAMFLSLYRRFRPHCSIFTSFEVDYVSHRFWRYHEPEKFPDGSRDIPRRLRCAVRDAYVRMDRCIGLLLEPLPADCVVAVVSEHGMAAEPTSNEIGKRRYMIDGNRVKALAGLGDDLVAIPIARWIAFRRRDGGPLGTRVARALGSMTVAETGLPLFRTHRPAEDEVVIKLNLHRADYPDVDDIGTLHVAVPGQGVLPIQRALERAGPTRSAMHAKEGIVILKGRGLRPGLEVKGAVVTDVMPTLLRASGLEVPPDLDGRVLDLFE